MLSEIIKDIKAKQELRTLSDAFISARIDDYLKTHPNIKSLDKITKKDRTIMIKRLRSVCRNAYGMFCTKKKKKRDKSLEEFRKEKSQENLKKLLLTHKSTKERMDGYPTLYEKIFAKTGKPKTILDLGCGMNPLSISFMDLKEVEYHAYDISEEDLDFIETFYKTIGKKITTKVVDLLTPEKTEFPKTDTVFMFKLLDHIDLHRSHKLSETLIKALNTKNLIISFSAKTLSNKPMRHPQRGWIERLLNRLGYRFTIIKTTGEIFYVAKK